MSPLLLPPLQVTAVHPLAVAVVQAVQVPPVIVAQANALSHPSATLPLLSNLPDVQVTAVHPLATAEVQAVHVPSATVAQQLKSSLFEVVANWLEGHVEHAFASTNGCNSGFDMYDPEGQHPNRAVLLVDWLDPRPYKKLLLPVNDDHVLPHNVRLKPLS